MIYPILTAILTKELVIAILINVLSISVKGHQCSRYYWSVKRVFCGMTYTGSSCEHIYKKYPEIYKYNPIEKSGYYQLSNNQWI